MTLESTKSRGATKASKPADKEKKGTDMKKPGSTKAETSIKNQEDIKKFELYFNFSCPVRNIKPHQVVLFLNENRMDAGTYKVTYIHVYKSSLSLQGVYV